MEKQSRRSNCVCDGRDRPLPIGQKQACDIREAASHRVGKAGADSTRYRAPAARARPFETFIERHSFRVRDGTVVTPVPGEARPTRLLSHQPLARRHAANPSRPIWQFVSVGPTAGLLPPPATLPSCLLAWKATEPAHDFTRLVAEHYSRVRDGNLIHRQRIKAARWGHTVLSSKASGASARTRLFA
jgi:hypothetical protein